MTKRTSIQRALSVVGAAVLLILAFDALSFAATGTGLVLGSSNKEHTITTLQNTKSGAALRLLTKSTKSAPFTTNATGKVANLYASRAATADQATTAKTAKSAATATTAKTAITAGDANTLGGSTATQLTAAARAGLFSQVINRDATESVTAGMDYTLDSFCNAGEVAIGGAVNIIADGTGTVITSRPDGDSFGDSPDSGGTMDGWRGVVHADSDGLLDVHAFCAS